MLSGIAAVTSQPRGVDSDHSRNRRAWDAMSDDYQRQHGGQLLVNAEAWGVWSYPESELQLLGGIVAIAKSKPFAVATFVTQPAEQFIDLRFEIRLDEFGDSRTAQLVQFARKIAIGLGNGIRFTVDSLQGVAPSGLSNRRLRRFFLNFPESRHELWTFLNGCLFT